MPAAVFWAVHRLRSAAVRAEGAHLYLKLSRLRDTRLRLRGLLAALGVVPAAVLVASTVTISR